MPDVFAAVMTMKHSLPAALLLGGLAFLAAPLRAETIRNHFDSDSLARTPGFFDFAVAGAPAKTRWLVLSDKNPPSQSNKLSQVEKDLPAGTIAIAVRRVYAFQDGSVSTFIQRGSGRAGLVLRMVDDMNFLILLADTATGDTVLSSYRDGKATELGRGHASAVKTWSWEKFAVAAAGPNLSVSFEGAKLFDATDPHPVSGRTGLAATGEASFDEFILEFEPAAPVSHN